MRFEDIEVGHVYESSVGNQRKVLGKTENQLATQLLNAKDGMTLKVWRHSDPDLTYWKVVKPKIKLYIRTYKRPSDGTLATSCGFQPHVSWNNYEGYLFSEDVCIEVDEPDIPFKDIWKEYMQSV